MSPKPVREYADILSRLKLSLNGEGSWGTLGKVANSKFTQSIVKIVLGESKSNRVLISAGIHGDEPAGVEAVCSFIDEKIYQKFLKDWEITLVPCINPFGYENNTRNNHEGVDLNRKFKSSSPPQEVILAQNLFHSTFDLTMELHEDVDSSGYYLFLSSLPGMRTGLAPEILKNVKMVMPINLDSEIDGIASKCGIIERVGIDQTMDWWPMAFYSLSKGTRTCLTLESATRFPMEVRIRAHLKAIVTALEILAGGR